MSVMDDARKRMQATIEHFKTELKGLRTGRANPAILDTIMVEVHGATMPLRKLANVTAPEARQLLVTPFDRQNTAAVGKAIEKANVGLQPIVDGQVVRINVPQMDTAMRNQIVKVLKKLVEETKIQVRAHRQDSNKRIKDQKSSGELSEDAAKKLEKQVQELTDQFCKEADKLASDKEKEIMTV